MTEKFKINQFNIEPSDEPTTRVIRPGEEAVGERKISSYQFSALNKGEGTYEKTKKKFGSLAVTDLERLSKLQKDRRFSLHPMQKSYLAVDEEEARAVQEKVQEEFSKYSQKIYDEAFEKGHSEGSERGYKEAKEKFESEAGGKLDRLENLISGLDEAKNEIFKANENFLISLIYQISRLILLKEIKEDREYLVRLTKHLIDRVGVKENITVRVHPEDIENVKEMRSSLEEMIGTLKNFKVEVSEGVNLGGCMLETEWNAIDASVETQFNRVKDSLLGAK